MRKKKEDRTLIPVYQIPRFIDESHVLSLTSRGWYIGKRKLGNDEIVQLKAEAADFERSYLWNLMRNDIHYVAYLQSTNKRHTEEDAIYGGAMYRAIEILEQFITQCKAL